MAEMTDDELAAWNAALLEFAPKQSITPIQKTAESSSTVAQITGYYSRLIVILEEGIQLINNPKTVNYFQSIRIYAKKEIARQDATLELIDKL